MNKANDIVYAAKKQVGVREATGNNDGAPSRLYMGSRREPWCAHFVAWIYRMCSVPLHGDVEPSVDVANPIASVDKLVEMNGPLMASGQPGDIAIFYERGVSDRSVSDDGKHYRHCGILSGVTESEYITIEGNSGNAVARRRYRINDPSIAGFVHLRGLR